MGIFTRFLDIVNSNINALLDKAEDPEKLLRLMIQEMEDTIIEMKTSCAAKMAEEIKAGDKIKEAEATVERWQNRARLALEKGREDMAREALVEKRAAMEALEHTKAVFKELSDEINESKDEIKTLEAKVKEARDKLKTLQERNERLKREKERGSNNKYSRFDEMEERINRRTYWNATEQQEDSVDEKFNRMERDSEIEAELEKLKKEANNS